MYFSALVIRESSPATFIETAKNTLLLSYAIGKSLILSLIQDVKDITSNRARNKRIMVFILNIHFTTFRIYKKPVGLNVI